MTGITLGRGWWGHAHDQEASMSSTRVAPAAVAFLTTLGTTALVTSPAAAAPPDNDGYAGRIVVGSVPFTTTQDTTEATTDADDAELNTDCGAPATDASVWYEVTAANDGFLIADVSQSDYSAGVLVGVGSPGSFQIVACGPGATVWDTAAGQTYAILVIDDQFDGGGNGGNMALTVTDEVPPPPEIDITVNPKGQFTRAGDAIVSGQVTCSGQAQFAFIDAQLSQQVGRLKINGFAGMEITCDGTTRPWSLQITGDNGIFRGGKAASITFAFACGLFDCGVDFEERVVMLSGKK
jgi:hypothetical protein